MIASCISSLSEKTSFEEAVLLRDKEASERTLRGIDLLRQSELSVALALFEEAIAIREELPWQENPWIRYGLAAGWMNRGDALARLGQKDRSDEAGRSYGRALEILRDLPVEGHPLFRKRHVIAWTNHGQVLMAREDFSGAIDSFERAQDLLKDGVDRDPALHLLLAGVRINLGNVFLSSSPRQTRRGLQSARQALAMVAGLEKEEPEAAEMAFQARHVLCRAAAFLLETEKLAGGEINSLIAEATEAVEQGLDLGRHWGARGEDRFALLLLDLFRFGARIYQLYQPRFLGEYLLEMIEDSASAGSGLSPVELHALAMEAMGKEMASIQRHAFVSWNSPQFEDLLARVRTLREVEGKLIRLRQAEAEKGMVS